VHRLQERRPVTPLTGDDSRGARRRRIAVLIAVVVLVVVADQVTKTLAVAQLRTRSDHVIGPFYLRLVYNSGVAFSFGRGLTGPIILIVVALIGLIAWLARGVPSMTAAVAFGLVLGGAIGNLSDRLFRSHHGEVVDFIYTSFWPTFNVADSCIVVGCFMLAITLVLRRRTAQRPSAVPAEPASDASE
jgi:signal peptidase II